MKVITSTTEGLKDYVDGLTEAITREELHKLLLDYDLINHKGLAQMPSEEDFHEFRRGLLSERRGEFAGMEWLGKYGDIITPWLLYNIELQAQRFGVPWGAAFLRLKELKLLKQREDHTYYLVL